MTEQTTISYYNDNANAFFEQTINVDMAPLYEKFLSYVPSSGRILDAGCGSGRDSKAFLDRGFNVDAFDASESLAKKASELIGQHVRCCRFDEIAELAVYDGIWACASLLHVQEQDLQKTIRGLVSSLRPGGIFYASFKNGVGERQDASGRHFTDMTLESLKHLIDENEGLELLEVWQTVDRRPGRQQEAWWNFIGRRTLGINDDPMGRQ